MRGLLTLRRNWWPMLAWLVLAALISPLGQSLESRLHGAAVVTGSEHALVSARLAADFDHMEFLRLLRENEAEVLSDPGTLVGIELLPEVETSE